MSWFEPYERNLVLFDALFVLNIGDNDLLNFGPKNQ